MLAKLRPVNAGLRSRRLRQPRMSGLHVVTVGSMSVRSGFAMILAQFYASRIGSNIPRLRGLR
jgi:hypothetical protein